MDRSVLVPSENIGHAVWGNGIKGINTAEQVNLASVRYFMFDRQVCIEHILIYPVHTRWAPPLFGQPAHLLLSYYDQNDDKWLEVEDVQLPQFESDTPHKILLNSLHTDHIRIVCDREHPVGLNHGEQWAQPEVVPFSILDRIEFRGQEIGKNFEPIWNPPLVKGKISPRPCNGQDVVYEPHQITYKSRYFSITFSLRRPIIANMGWDDMGEGLSCDNLVPNFPVWGVRDRAPSICGPIYNTLSKSLSSQHWTGEVYVDGNRVIYKNLKAIDDFTMDVVFEILEKGMKVSIEKTVNKPFVAIEADEWRFVWDLEKSVTGTIASPTGMRGRTGLCHLPARWNAPGHGTISIKADYDSEKAFLQVDSWREYKVGWSGISLPVPRDEYGMMHFEKGTYRTNLSFTVEPMQLRIKKSKAKDSMPKGIQRNWSSGFTFRPELAGFSNNSVSTNCHLSQYLIADMAPFDKPSEGFPSMTELYRYTLELSLRGGPGYGDCRDYYIDSDPSILIGVGRLQQAEPDEGWLRRVWPRIREMANRMLDNTDETGLIKCRNLTGNANSNKWSSNGWDVIGFGNYDAYSNALAYRAMRNMIALSSITNDEELHRICLSKAEAMKASYKECFFNPETGWLAGWRSADGKLHDYAFTNINSMAICYGLVEEDQAKDILIRLEEKMKQCGLNYYYYGIPLNLISTRKEDVPALNNVKREDGLDKYGIYINGCLNTAISHYIRALDMCGLNSKADIVCDHLEKSFAENRIVGGMGSGTEFFTWEGRPCGYEGVLVGMFPVLATIAQHRGLIEKMTPEWWLDDIRVDA